MTRVVLIDIDNTLLSFDGYVREALAEGLPKFGICDYREGMEKIFHRVNNELWQQLERGELTYSALYAQRFDRIFEALCVTGDGPLFETYFREKLYDSAVIMEGAREIVDYLADRYLLCAASNGPYEQQRNRLAVCGMLPKFHSLFISEDIGASKPDKLFFERAFDRLREQGISVRPEECVIIGDSLTSDMAGGIAAGVKTIYYDLSGTGETGGKKVDHIVTTLSGIRKIL